MKDTEIALKTPLEPSPLEPSIEAEQVREYLEQNADFFVHNKDLLASLSLPHPSGKAVSLVERQVSVLRSQNRAAEQKLQELLNVARDNEHLFDKTRDLTLAMLDAPSLDELAEVLEERFREDFNTDAGGLILLTANADETSGNTRSMAYAELQAAAPRFASLKEVAGGALRDAEIELLFPLHDHRILSAMVAPVFPVHAPESAVPVALLALGSADRGYFHDRLGTSFLDYIARVLGRILSAHMPAPQ